MNGHDCNKVLGHLECVTYMRTIPCMERWNKRRRALFGPYIRRDHNDRNWTTNTPIFRPVTGVHWRLNPRYRLSLPRTVRTCTRNLKKNVPHILHNQRTVNGLPGWVRRYGRNCRLRSNPKWRRRQWERESGPFRTANSAGRAYLADTPAVDGCRSC